MTLRIRRWHVSTLVLALLGVTGYAIALRYDYLPKRVRPLEAGSSQLVRGAWQRPGPLRDLVERHRIKTILTLTAINVDDPKYIDQQNALDGLDVEWLLIPMRGSTATVEQLAEAADILADPAHQPIFFHCVAGHHRTSLAQAAYRIRHQGWSAEEAWNEVASYPWARPEKDHRDRDLIATFAAWNARLALRDLERSGRGVGVRR